jgi:hypothetical protein
MMSPSRDRLAKRRERSSPINSGYFYADRYREEISATGSRMDIAISTHWQIIDERISPDWQISRGDISHLCLTQLPVHQRMNANGVLLPNDLFSWNR